MARSRPDDGQSKKSLLNINGPTLTKRKPGQIVLDQIRTVDKNRLPKSLAKYHGLPDVKFSQNCESCFLSSHQVKSAER